MYIDEIFIENYGCIENLAIKPELNEKGQPKPIVLVGKNGSGKTLLLSNIVDSMIEFKRIKYSELKEVLENKYYKLGSKTYIRSGQNYSYTKVRYNNHKVFSYVDCMAKNVEYFKSSEYNTNLHTELELENTKFKDNGFYKKVNPPFDNEFDTNVFLYFPVHRFYEPAWLNQKINISFEKEERFIEKSNKNIIKTNILNQIETWILDVILDERLYELDVRNFSNLYFKTQNSDGKDYYYEAGYKVFLGYNGKNSTIRNLLNTILTKIYISKDKDIKQARIGISRKENGRQISIILVKNDDTEIDIAPTFNHLSSGEALLLSIFGTLLKEYDSLGYIANNLSDVKGVVVIDEIDLNLHIDYAKNVLPNLMQLFPNIQFIVTTHSPFFLLGMKEVYKNDYQLINLPNGENITENDFSEIVAAYNIFTKGFDDLKANLYSLEQRIKLGTKPLIITEGKTDWKHFKTALTYYQKNSEFVDVDVVFMEYNDEIQMGDSQLDSLLKNLAKIKQERVIVGIFDCDEANGRNYAKEDYKDFGNNVFGFSIPLPVHRLGHSGISVELLYKDADLMKLNVENRRLYLTSEFNERGRLISNNSISVQNADKIKKYLEPNNCKITDCEITDGNENLALSKSDFSILVLNQVTPFHDMSFEGFRGVFEKLRIIINSN